MAPKFAILMYQVYASGDAVDALVCFPVEQSESILPFRDKLTEALIKNSDTQVHREQGYPLPSDSTFKFYAQNHAITVENFLQEKQPGFFSRLLNTADWVSFQKDEKSVGEMIDTEIETSHDFPCIVVHSRIHSEESMSKLIQEVSKSLNLNMQKNAQLGSIQKVVTSNRSFT